MTIAADPDTVGPVPLAIGVVGHRDLVAEEMPRLRERVREFLLGLRAEFPGLPMVMLNPLAEGADRLVAHEARALGIPLIALLPMPRALYRQDFSTEASVREFEVLCAGARVLELPLLNGAGADAVSQPGRARDRQYAQLAIFLSAHCHILLALWDGRSEGRHVGGTGQVVHFHHHDVMPGYSTEPRKYSALLADDESDLVYHIVVSRDRPGGAPEPPLRPCDAAWFTVDEEAPRQASLPEHYRRIFGRMTEFNADGASCNNRARSQKVSLLGCGPQAYCAPQLEGLDEMFGITDWLARHYQSRFSSMLKALYTIGLLIGLSFVAYVDGQQDEMIYVYLVLFATGSGLYHLAARGGWHRKYLDYRALAEGLRVQFYWAMAGVVAGQETKYTHDIFLQKQDVELGWIRNVMRYTGLHSDMERRPDAAGISFSVREWIGDEASGQTGYYGTGALLRARRNNLTNAIGRVCLWVGISAALALAALAVMAGSVSSSGRFSLTLLMTILPLIAAVREAYAHKKGERELINQYRFMHRVFRNAGRKIAAAQSDAEKLAVLKAVGEVSLHEHAQWVLIHRERPLEISR